MNGLSIIEDNYEEELKDEDLPVQPYKSKNKKTIKIESYVDENEKKDLGEIDQINEEIKEDIIQTKESIKENIIQIEKSIDEGLIQEDKSKTKKSEIEIKKELKKEEKLNFDIFNKEYDEMFPPKRPEDYN